jgi:hypothetical protein
VSCSKPLEVGLVFGAFTVTAGASKDGGPFCGVDNASRAPSLFGGRQLDPVDAYDPGSLQPKAFALKGNYPNPFNPQTVIHYSVPESAHIRLLVYDVVGREVARLVDVIMEAGNHTVTFDAGRLPSGTYLYRLETPVGSFAETMVFMK